MKKYNTLKTGKYEVIALLLGKSKQAVKKYFWYNKKDILNPKDLKEYFKKEYNKWIIESINKILS